MKNAIENAIEKHRGLILEAERHIWKNPETGFREWKTHAYLKEKFEELGYKVKETESIPGFCADIDTGIPGPIIAVFGELDSLIVPTHPECDPQTGAVHACGHHAQCAALLGVAAALKAPGVTDGLCGSVRLVAVPAEEGIELEFRRKLKQDGVIRYYSGKTEFLYRGLLDGVDMAMMIHAATSQVYKIACPMSTNGNISKRATFHGRSAHAGGSPHQGRNALYAATTALSAANALRETWRDADTVRFHPIITKGGSAVNAIPDEVITEAYARAADIKTMRRVSEQMNRAFAGAAAAMGCTVEFEDEFKSAPRINDKTMRALFHRICSDYYNEEEMNLSQAHGTACSDMGNICCVMPAIQANVAGACGNEHGSNYKISDPENVCVTGAKILTRAITSLLEKKGALAKTVLENATVPFPSKEEFFSFIDSVTFHSKGVLENEDGSLTLKFKE